MKAVKPINPHPMVAKVAHPQKIRQVKAVKAQVKMAHPHKDKVDKVMAIHKAVKVKAIPIVVRVKVMVTEMAMAIPTLKVKAIPKVEMKATHPKVAMVAKKIPIPTEKVTPKKIPM